MRLPRAAGPLPVAPRGGPGGGPPAPPARARQPEGGRRLWAEAECATCHGVGGRGDGPAAQGMKDDWGSPTRPGDLTWRPLKPGAAPEGLSLTTATGLTGTPMPSYGDALEPRQIWALVGFLESLVPPARRLPPEQALGGGRGGGGGVGAGGGGRGGAG